MPARRGRPARKTGARVCHDGAVIEYEIRRDARLKRKLKMRVGPEGLVVSVPPRASVEAIQKIVLKEAPWVVKKLSEQSRVSLPGGNKATRRAKGTRKTLDQVSYNGTVIEYAIRRNARRKNTVAMQFEPEGLVVSAPPRARDEEIRKIVLKRAPWILERMAERSRESLPRKFITGERVPYLGRSIELVVEDGEGPGARVTLSRGKFRVSGPVGLSGEERRASIRKAFAAWYRARAEERIPKEVKKQIDLLWTELGKRSRYRVIIGNQRSRWGSCSSDRTLRFSWRTMMLSPDIIEYIVVHELAHLSVMNHSSEFWDLVDGVLFTAKRSRKELGKVTATLPL